MSEPLQDSQFAEPRHPAFNQDKYKDLMDQAHAESTAEPERIEHVDGLEVKMGPRSQRLEFDINIETGQPVAVGYTDVAVSGLWHLSRGPIDKFTDDKVSELGNLGPGTYVGAGDPSALGVQVRELLKEPHYAYGVGVSGNVLFVPTAEQENGMWAVVERAEADGFDPDSVGNGNPGKLLNRILRAHAVEHEVDGAADPVHVRYNALIFHSDRRIEGVVFNPESALHIESAEQVNPTA